MTDALSRDELLARIRAAGHIYNHPKVEQHRQDEALYAGRQATDLGDPNSVLRMAAAVNHLYNARHKRLVEAADRIVEAKEDGELDDGQSPLAIVKAIGPLERGKSACPHLRFASKFAHFCIRQDIPMYDTWVWRAVGCHFEDARSEPPDTLAAYGVLVDRIRCLQGLAPSITCRQLDWYLWLYGMCRAYCEYEGEFDKIKDPGLSGDVKRWLKDPNLRRWFRELHGYTCGASSGHRCPLADET